MKKDQNILLIQLPFWTPLIPPQGIARIKKALISDGFRNIKTIDFNIEEIFKAYYEKYFNTLKEFISEYHQGNYYDNGHDVLKNHMMAKINWEDKDEEYYKLVSSFIEKIFLTKVENEKIIELDNVLSEYFIQLKRYMKHEMDNFNPQIIGFSAHAGNLASILFCSKLAKKLNRNITNVVGGSVFAGELNIKSPNFITFCNETTSILDKIFVGQDEEFLIRYLNDRCLNEERVIIQDNNKISIHSSYRPDLSDFDIKKYPMLATYCSKSCPNECSFCNEKNFFGKYEERNLSLAIDDLLYQYRNYNKKLYYMLDVIMNDTIESFCEQISQYNLPIYFDAYLKVAENVCNLENTYKWRKGGLYRVRLGIESGSQRMLDSIGKNIRVEQSKRALFSLSNAGIKTTAYMVVGLPGETEEDFLETLDFIKENKDYLYQVEPHLFRYFYDGQSDSEKWEKNRVSLFPSKYENLLITQSWVVDGNPRREVAIDRLCKIIELCKSLGISNPYSIYERYIADKRWQQLHENSVPSVAELNDEKFFDSCRNLENYVYTDNELSLSDDFAF